MADVIRDIVKKEAQLYRETELERQKNEDITHFKKSTQIIKTIEEEKIFDTLTK